MIYSFNIRTEYGEKQFYLTAEDQRKLYKRIQSTYGVDKNQVELLAEYEETPDYGYKLIKSHVKEESNVDSNLSKEASNLYKNACRKDDPVKTDYFIRHKFKDIIKIDSYKDIIPLLGKYKKLKVCWELGEKRGQHNYYVMVK